MRAADCSRLDGSLLETDVMSRKPLLDKQHAAVNGAPALQIVIAPASAANKAPAHANSALLSRPFLLRGFAQLPQVLVTQVMIFLDGRSALRVGEVCKAWRGPSNADQAWQRTLTREMPHVLLERKLESKRGKYATAVSNKALFVQERAALMDRCVLLS